MRPLIKAAKLNPKAVRVTGPALARSFVLRPDAATTVEAEAMVRSLLDARRDEDGKWVKLAITAPDGSEVCLYTDPDRSLAQRRTAWHLAQARKVVAQRHPSIETAMARADGTLTVQWQPIFSCHFVEGDRSVKWSWDAAAVDKLGMN